MVAHLSFDGGQAAHCRALGLCRVGVGAEPRVSVGKCLELDDGVLVVGRLLGWGEAEGEDLEEPFVHECFVRCGRLVRIRQHPA